MTAVKTLLAAALALALAITGATATEAAPIRTAKASVIFAGGLYVQPDSVASLAAPTLHGAEKRAARYIAKRPVAVWLGDWARGKTLVAYLQRNLAASAKQGTTAVFVTYAIPNRDCGGHSAGGLTPSAYVKWNALIAKTLQGRRAVVLIEPDSLSTLDVCPAGTAEARIPLLAKAVAGFASAKISAYLDGSLSGRESVDSAAAKLTAAGVAKARGFFTNVANYRATADEQAWGDALSRATGDAHYVIDVSRNGRGYTGDWCNAPGTGLGQDPHVVKRDPRLDALLWVKTPGASDGTCNGGPVAGAWFASFAASLYANRAR